MQETPAGRKETKPSPDTEAARSPARRRPQHYPAACSHPSGGDARERSGWGFSQISLHHDAGGRGPGFSGLMRSTGHICRQERKRKGKRSEAQPSMAEGTRPLWGGSHRRRQSPRAPRLPFPQEDEDKGPHPSPRNPTPPTPNPRQTTPSSQKRQGRSHVCAKGARRTNDAPLGTPESWEPWPQPIGPCHSRWWADPFAVNPWPRRSTGPLRRDPTPGTEGKRTA